MAYGIDDTIQQKVEAYRGIEQRIGDVSASVDADVVRTVGLIVVHSIGGDRIVNYDCMTVRICNGVECPHEYETWYLAVERE